uniref:Uncharacterized protein n=1 Tax=Nelumbo nucifera TaxID=4432 RepID=A0A822Y2W6_NELNU|nr:TPA_asm: hypothetical protein HUJ06_028070 [Nelumbo nucifera]
MRSTILLIHVFTFWHHSISYNVDKNKYLKGCRLGPFVIAIIKLLVMLTTSNHEYLVGNG